MNTQPSRPPFQPPNDCSQGFCSIYCPRWCYFIFPPPPPSPDFDASPTISPLLIVVIALAALALLLFGYYTTYKYWQRQHHQHQLQSNLTSEEAPDSWASTSSPGLDDSLIDRITVCKYRKGIEHTNCSVCLSDFNEDDNLRLLPKCTHAFHVECIDTWLKSNPNCPLCRASIVCPSPSLGPLVALESRVDRSEQIDEVVVVVHRDSETVLGNHNNEETSKGSSESLGSDAGREHHSSYSVVEISGDVIQSIR